MCLQREIEGDLLDTADPNQVRAAGAVLARLQDALAAYPDADRIATLAGPSEPLTDRVTDWLDSGAMHVPATARDTLRRLAPTRQPTGYCHSSFTTTSAPPTSCAQEPRSPRSSTSRRPGSTTESSSWHGQQ